MVPNKKHPRNWRGEANPCQFRGWGERGRNDRDHMQPQQTGVPFIIMQQVQPAFIMVAMQSQQA
jgi:hypothetical protein